MVSLLKENCTLQHQKTLNLTFPFSFEPFLSRHVAAVLTYYVVVKAPQRSVVCFKHPVVFFFFWGLRRGQTVEVVTGVWLLCVYWSAASSTCSEGQFSGSAQTFVVSTLVGLFSPHSECDTCGHKPRRVCRLYVCSQHVRTHDIVQSSMSSNGLINVDIFDLSPDFFFFFGHLREGAVIFIVDVFGTLFCFSDFLLVYLHWVYRKKCYII